MCEGFGYVGLTLESALNTARDGDDRDVATPGSAVKVLVIAAREDLTILGEVKGVLGWE